MTAPTPDPDIIPGLRETTNTDRRLPPGVSDPFAPPDVRDPFTASKNPPPAPAPAPNPLQRAWRGITDLWGAGERRWERELLGGTPTKQTPSTSTDPQNARREWERLKENWRVLRGGKTDNEPPQFRIPQPAPGGELGPPYGGPMGNPDWIPYNRPPPGIEFGPAGYAPGADRSRVRPTGIRSPGAGVEDDQGRFVRGDPGDLAGPPSSQPSIPRMQPPGVRSAGYKPPGPVEPTPAQDPNLPHMKQDWWNQGGQMYMPPTWEISPPGPYMRPMDPNPDFPHGGPPGWIYVPPDVGHELDPYTPGGGVPYGPGEWDMPPFLRKKGSGIPGVPNPEDPDPPPPILPRHPTKPSGYQSAGFMTDYGPGGETDDIAPWDQPWDKTKMYDPNNPTGGSNFNPDMKIDTSHASNAPPLSNEEFWKRWIEHWAHPNGPPPGALGFKPSSYEAPGPNDPHTGPPPSLSGPPSPPGTVSRIPPDWELSPPGQYKRPDVAPPPGTPPGWKTQWDIDPHIGHELDPYTPGGGVPYGPGEWDIPDPGRWAGEWNKPKIPGGPPDSHGGVPAPGPGDLHGNADHFQRGFDEGRKAAPQFRENLLDLIDAHLMTDLLNELGHLGG